MMIKEYRNKTLGPTDVLQPIFPTCISNHNEAQIFLRMEGNHFVHTPHPIFKKIKLGEPQVAPLPLLLPLLPPSSLPLSVPCASFS